MSREKETHNPDTHLGLLLEFADERALTAAAARGLDAAMGIRQSRLPLFVIGGGFAGVGAGLLLQWWAVTIAYPYILSGKPFFALPAFIPVMFELAILFGALAAVFGMFFLNRLPKFYHPVFNSPGFRRATQDRFFIHLDAADPLYDADKTRAFAESLGADVVENLEVHTGA